MQFFKSIFLFKTFIALHVVRVTFCIGCLAAVLLTGYLFYKLQWSHLLVALGVPPLVFIASVTVWRITLEMCVALIRIAENTTKLVEMKESKEG